MLDLSKLGVGDNRIQISVGKSLAAHQFKKAPVTCTVSGGQGNPTFDTAQAIAVMLEKHGIACDIIHGFNWDKWTTGKPTERLALIGDGQTGAWTDTAIAAAVRKCCCLMLRLAIAEAGPWAMGRGTHEIHPTHPYRFCCRRSGMVCCALCASLA